MSGLSDNSGLSGGSGGSGGSGPAGTDGQVQYNNAGTTAGAPNTVVNSTTGVTTFRGLTLASIHSGENDTEQLFTHDNSSSSYAEVKFGMAYNGGDQVVGGKPGGGNYTIDSWSFGINSSGMSTRQDAAQPYLAIEFESKFCQTPAVSPMGSEFHLTHIGTFDSTFRRMISGFCPIDQIAGSLLTFKSDQLNWLGWESGTALMNWAYSSATPSLNVNHNIRAIYAFATNNASWAQQRNAANSAYLDLPYYDAGNVLKTPSAAYFVGSKPGAGATYTNAFVAYQPTGAWSSGDIGIYFAGPTITGSMIGQQMVGDATTGFSLDVYNNRGASGAHAYFYARTISSSGGDPKIMFDINGVKTYSAGIDNSGSDAFVICESSALGTSNVVRIANGGEINVCAGTATPAGGSTSARLVFGTTAGFGIYYGSGAPSSLTAGKGSLYLRSDGSGVADRLYVNTDAGTTWTTFTSAA